MTGPPVKFHIDPNAVLNDLSIPQILQTATTLRNVFGGYLLKDELIMYLIFLEMFIRSFVKRGLLSKDLEYILNLYHIT